MKLFVYGTLKKGGANHKFLKDSKYVSQYCLNNHILIDLGYGFPYMIKGDGSVLGEVYEINQKTLNNIDRLEGHPNHYKRYLANYYDEIAGMYYYLSGLTNHVKHSEWASEYKNVTDGNIIVKDGYWPINNQKMHVKIDDRNYFDTADKLVFHMRFFDGDRTPLNRDYMEMLKNRSKIQLNTDDEEIFVRQCIAKNIVKEICS